jgi:hypothetical protein
MREEDGGVRPSELEWVLWPRGAPNHMGVVLSLACAVRLCAARAIVFIFLAPPRSSTRRREWKHP